MHNDIMGADSKDHPPMLAPGRYAQWRLRPTFNVEPLENVQMDDEYNVFSNEHEHTKQPENMNDIALMEKVDSNIIPDSSYLCNNDFQDDQYAKDNDDGRVMLTNLIANLKLDTDENKKIQKQFRKAHATLTHELNEYKSALEETTDIKDRCRNTLHHKEIKLEKFKVFKNCQLEKEEVEHKYKETLDLLAQRKHQLNEALKIKAYETFQFKEKNPELEHIIFDILHKEKEQMKKDFKISQEKDIENLIALENQVKFLNDIVYKTNQSIQSVHMLASDSSSYYNGREIFINLKYLKKAQPEKACLYKVPYDKDYLANIFAPNYDEILILEEESRSKLDKELIKKYDYTYQNSLYELFTPQTHKSLVQLYFANEIRKKIWRKSFVKCKPNIVKN
nr:hypothetical protein [Tanacetum cinerariifolium]